jgi:hypothetical protein
MKAGKYLYLPPGYEGEVPKGYTVLKPKTYRVWIFLRASIADGVDKAAEFVKSSLKIYPLSKADNPPEMKFVSASEKSFNTIHPKNIEFFYHLDEIIQYEDGSTDIYFGPEAPGGNENNWLETIPGKSWFVILRMYDPLKPWIEKTWRPGEVELAK